MHGWIRHPLGAGTPLVSVGQDPAWGPWGAGSVSAVSRRSHGAGTSQGAPHQCWRMKGDVFPSPPTLCRRNAPNLLAACATCPHSNYEGHLWVQALCPSVVPVAGRLQKQGCFTLNLSLPMKSVWLHSRDTRLVLGCPFGDVFEPGVADNGSPCPREVVCSQDVSVSWVGGSSGWHCWCPRASKFAGVAPGCNTTGSVCGRCCTQAWGLGGDRWPSRRSFSASGSGGYSSAGGPHFPASRCQPLLTHGL